jgi:glutaminase
MKTTSPKTNVREVVLVEQPVSPSFQEQEYKAIYSALPLYDDGTLPIKHLIKLLDDIGIDYKDPRLNLKELFTSAEWANSDTEDIQSNLTFEQFKKLMQKSQGSLLRDAIQGNLVISDFKTFVADITKIYAESAKNNEGKVASYIPQLGRVSPDNFGVSFCTIDGQRHSLGDSHTSFCIQSMSKPISYCIALEQYGEDYVHRHVGREPSGIGFNGLVLNTKGLPHNPMINSGAIMTCSLIRPEWEMADRFDHVLDVWSKLSGGKRAGFNNSVYLSERQTADRNFALGYFMRENKAFPPNTDLISTLEFYFQCCSIELTTESLAVVAATLANGGICPVSGERIFQPNTVKNCLGLMSSCGMYDFSGEFAFTIGLPAKSGVAGGLMVVVPNLLGIAIWSPALDNLGNTVRGIDFCKRLVNQFNFHVFDSLVGNLDAKKDPRQQRSQSRIDGVISLCWAASEGDLKEVQHLVARGVDINQADYDGRTALHLAASEGRQNVVEYLLDKGATKDPKDRWGGTPLDDAKRGNHEGITSLLIAWP